MDHLTELLTGRFAWILPILAAPFVGSFLGVVIKRLPEGKPVALARSQRESCGHTLAAYDLIPCVSFAVLHGCCRTCGTSIGWFAPAVELAAVLIAAWAATFTQGASLWLACLFGWMLLASAWIDLRTMLLPDKLTLPLLGSGLVATAIVDFDALPDHVAASALGYLTLYAVAATYRRLRGREGLGMGDAKLLAGLGAWIGVEFLPVVLLGSACLGLTMALGARLVGVRLAGHAVTAHTRIPFGPFLAFAGWLVWLHGDALGRWVDDLVTIPFQF